MHREEVGREKSVREKSVRAAYLSFAKRELVLARDRLYHIMIVGKKESVITGLVVLRISLAISRQKIHFFLAPGFRKSTFSVHRH
jgi:hypothetical protein